MLLDLHKVSQERGKIVWYSQLFKSFPQFIMIHTVKGVHVVSETEVDVFLELPVFVCDLVNAGNLISGSSFFGFSGSGKEPACHCRRHKRCELDPWVGKIPWRRA